MGKKKCENTIKSEEDAFNELQRLMQVWRNKGSQSSYSKRSHLSSIKKKFRSSRVCQIIFSNPDMFNIEEEHKYVPIELMSEEFLIKMVYDYPKLLSSRDESGFRTITRTITIPEEKQTLPVLVAFELGKRCYERLSSKVWGADGEKIPYTNKTLEFRGNITDIADRVEERIGANNLKPIRFLKNEEQRESFFNELVTAIKEETADVSLQKDEQYEPKHTSFDYNSDKKLLVLVSGYSDTGKTIFSSYLASKINGAICFDSDQLLKKGLLHTRLSELVNSQNNVVIFSDTDASLFFSPSEILAAMGDVNILKVQMQPSSIYRMLHHSKYRQRSRN